MGKTFPLPIKAVVIDLDGTLLDTAPDIAEAASRMLQDLAQPPVELGQIRSYIGNGISVLVKRALTGSMHGEPDEAMFAKALPVFQQHYQEVLVRETRPYPGVVEGLGRMKAAGFRLACITNKAERFTLPLLAAMGMKDSFELILSGDSLPKKKPDPLPLLHACQQFGVKPEEMLLIGDSLNDSVAARAAGCHVFLVPYGYNGGRDVGEQDSDAVVADLVEAAGLIRKI